MNGREPLLLIKDRPNIQEYIKTLPTPIIISTDYEKMRSVFAKVSSRRLKCLIVDKKLNVVFSSSFIDNNETLRVELNRLLRKERFDIGEFVTKGKKIGEVEWLDQLSEIASENANCSLHIFSIFSTICDSCRSGSLVSYLNSVVHKYSDINVAILVPNYFSNQDLANLISQLKLNSPIYRAERLFWEKWDQLMDKYGVSEISDVIFVVGEDGIINSVFSRECNCYSGLSDVINSRSGLDR